MQVNRERMEANIRAAATEDLLDRATVFRAGMEAEAVEAMEGELRRRGINREFVAEYERKQREDVLFDAHGIALTCHRCRRPAVVQTRSWHRVWGILPLFRRRLAWCREHTPNAAPWHEGCSPLPREDAKG